MKSEKFLTSLSTYSVESYGLTDVGMVRENNEDAWSILAPYRLFVLADGMGGHSAGEVASHEAIEHLLDFAKQKTEEDWGEQTGKERRKWLHEGIKRANQHVYSLSRKDRELRGMGTTLCVASFHREGLFIAHVGDSRIYRLRAAELLPLTQDHSLVSEMIELGELHPKYRKKNNYRHIITKAIGTMSTVEPSYDLLDIYDGDIYLICSDGLTDLVHDEEIHAVLSSTPLSEVPSRLIDMANEKGGWDNTTLIAIQIHKGDEVDLPGS